MTLLDAFGTAFELDFFGFAERVSPRFILVALTKLVDEADEVDDFEEEDASVSLSVFLDDASRTMFCDDSRLRPSSPPGI